ncbi:MAG: hypothetical protein QG635_2425, partial [Bacteroidota bacterium]|nr:hypothetical protein [Bacteroidota bacterium]
PSVDFSSIFPCKTVLKTVNHIKISHTPEFIRRSVCLKNFDNGILNRNFGDEHSTAIGINAVIADNHTVAGNFNPDSFAADCVGQV